MDRSIALVGAEAEAGADTAAENAGGLGIGLMGQ